MSALQNLLSCYVKTPVRVQRLFFGAWLTWAQCILPVTLAYHVHIPSSATDPRALCLLLQLFSISPTQQSETFTCMTHFYYRFIVEPLFFVFYGSTVLAETNTKWSLWVCFWLLACNVCDPYGWFKRFRQWVQRGAFLMTKLMWLSEWVWERGIEGLEEGNLLAEMNV